MTEAIPFDRDAAHAASDADCANRFWRLLLVSHDVFSYFRSSCLGKAFLALNGPAGCVGQCLLMGKDRKTLCSLRVFRGDVDRTYQQ
jgi:hypothetical protein